MKYKETIQIFLNKCIEIIKSNKRKIGGGIFAGILILMIVKIVEKNNNDINLKNEVLMLENLTMKKELLNDQLKFQVMYYIMLTQQDSIKHYRENLKNCKNDSKRKR